MDSVEIQKIYQKKSEGNRSERIFYRINILFAFALAIFFLVFGIKECNSGFKVDSFAIPVLIEPLNEIGERAKEEQKEADKEEMDKKEEDENQSHNKINQEAWEKLFSEYAQKLVVQDHNLFYEMRFEVGQLPLNQGDVDIAFEIYDKNKNYLFTFYASYWNEDGYESGYEDGEYYNEYWHEEVKSENIYIQFPEPGEYYIVAGIPQGDREMFRKISIYSKGKVFFSLWGNSKPFPSSTIFAFLFFMGAGFLLFFNRNNQAWETGKNHRTILMQGLDFNQYHYLVELDNELFFITGFSRKNPEKENIVSIEFSLARDGKTIFLEIEEETEIEIEDGERSVEVSYSYYLYDCFPEDDFNTIPDSQSITYDGKTFKHEGVSEYAVSHFYYNGLREDSNKKEILYGYKEVNYLVFEYAENPEEWDVSYGRKIQKPKIWEIKK